MSGAPSLPRHLLVVGFGQLGGSVALAARERSAATEIVAVDPEPQARSAAASWGVTALAACPDRIDQDLVVVCAPFESCARALGDIAPRLVRPTAVTDVAGLKAPLVRHAASLAASYPHLEFVGAHPITGSHLRGAAHARADLFERAPCALVGPGPGNASAERVQSFWQSLGCHTAWMAAEEHDRQMAATTALPQIVAAALAGAVRQQVGGSRSLLAGPGLRDTTRLADSEPELWAGILVTNREAVLAAWRLFLQHCERWEKALASGDRTAVERLLEEDREARARLLQEPDPVRTRGT